MREISFQVGFPVLVDPYCHSPWRGPDSCELPDECLFCKFESEGSGVSLDLDRGDLIQIFYKLRGSLFVCLGKRGDEGGESCNILGRDGGGGRRLGDGGPEAPPGEEGMRENQGIRGRAEHDEALQG
jgi:hypothetical protein